MHQLPFGKEKEKSAHRLSAMVIITATIATSIALAALAVKGVAVAIAALHVTNAAHQRRLKGKQEAYDENKITELLESRRNNFEKSLRTVNCTIDELTLTLQETDRLIQEQDDEDEGIILHFYKQEQMKAKKQLEKAKDLENECSNLSSLRCDKMRKYEMKLREYDFSLRELHKLFLDRKALSSVSCGKMRKYEMKLQECEFSLRELRKLFLDREAADAQRIASREPKTWSVDPQLLRCLLISHVLFAIYVLVFFFGFIKIFKINISVLLQNGV